MYTYIYVHIIYIIIYINYILYIYANIHILSLPNSIPSENPITGDGFSSQVEMVLDHSHTLLVMLGIYAHKITYSIYVEHIMTNYDTNDTSNFRLLTIVI